MSRRRMIDPLFYSDSKLGKMTRDERYLIEGCVCFADDEGRLQGDTASLKSQIFKYDRDLDEETIKTLRDSCLEKMKTWPSTHPYRLILYQNSEEEYLFLPNWATTNRPSHAVPSRLPVPSPELLPVFSSGTHEGNQSDSSDTPESLRPRSGQSSQGKVSVGQVSVVLEDFTNLNEKDMTDRLTTSLTKNISAGRAAVLAKQKTDEILPEVGATIKSRWGLEVLKKCWQDNVGEKMPDIIMEGAGKLLKDYPLEFASKVFSKGIHYKGGKHKSWRYFETIIEEELERQGNHAARAP